MDPIQNRKTLQKLKTRQHIMDVALKLFAENSVGSVTLEEIAEKANIARGTLYNHFSNKDDLLFSIVQPVAEESSALLDELIRSRQKISLDDILLSYLKMWKKYRNFLRLNNKLEPYLIGLIGKNLNKAMDDILNDKIELMPIGFTKYTNALNDRHYNPNKQYEELGKIVLNHSLKTVEIFKLAAEKYKFRFKDPQLTSYILYKTFIPVLENIENLPEYETLFIESFRALLLIDE